MNLFAPTTNVFRRRIDNGTRFLTNDNKEHNTNQSSTVPAARQQSIVIERQQGLVITLPITLMGSYLTVVNDTPVEWRCKVGLDQNVLKIIMYGASVLWQSLYVVGFAAQQAAALPVVVALGPPVLVTVGTGSVLMLALHTITEVSVADLLTNVYRYTKVIRLGGKYNSLGTRVSDGIYQGLEAKGYLAIAPDGRRRYGKMTLSLWQEAACVRLELRDQSSAMFHILYMRPIFSGSTINSNRDHSIQWWLDKRGAEELPIQAKLDEAIHPL